MAGRSLKGVIQVCASKRRFSSLDEVRLAARPGLKWYRCVACGGLHLTSQVETTGSDSAPADERKQTYETSMMGRAKLVRQAKLADTTRVVVGICLSKPQPNGRVKVCIEGREYESTSPIQPAHLRQKIQPGAKLKLEFSAKPLVVRVLADQCLD